MVLWWPTLEFHHLLSPFPADPITFWEWYWNLNTLLKRWLYTTIIIWQGDWIPRVCIWWMLSNKSEKSAVSEVFVGSTPESQDSSGKKSFKLGFPILKMSCHPGGDWNPEWGGRSKVYLVSKTSDVALQEIHTPPDWVGNLNQSHPQVIGLVRHSPCFFFSVQVELGPEDQVAENFAAFNMGELVPGCHMPC